MGPKWAIVLVATNYIPHFLIVCKVNDSLHKKDMAYYYVWT